MYVLFILYLDKCVGARKHQSIEWFDGMHIISVKSNILCMTLLTVYSDSTHLHPLENDNEYVCPMLDNRSCLCVTRHGAPREDKFYDLTIRCNIKYLSHDTQLGKSFADLNVTRVKLVLKCFLNVPWDGETQLNCRPSLT